MAGLDPERTIMAYRNLKAAILAAVWCAAVAGCASSRAPATTPVYPDVESYREARERLVRKERARRLGAALVLSAEEEAADRRLVSLRDSEKERLGAYFPPSHSFLLEKTRRLIEESPLLEVMRRLPKGGILHVHGAAGGDLHWLVSYATYRPDCYMYLGDEGSTERGTLRFFAQPPGGHWRPVVALRSAAPDPRAFDEEIYRSITLGEEDHNAPDIWEEFRRCFRRAFGLFDDEETRAGHWPRMLADLIDDDVQYVEFRGWPVDEAVVREARLRDPDFDVKFIPAAGRSSDQQGVRGALGRTLAEREREPGRVVGFDLVDEEDRTHSTLFFAPELLDARLEAGRRGLTLPLFLHSGETSRAEDGNLYDAVLLGARRIGHGLALVRHPLLMEMVRERGIAIEVCPISNQVLGYVGDLRAHPAVAFINAGIPVVLSPDDPGIMRHTLSHDFYEAFMAWELDLRDLKQLAMGSLLYSAMGPQEKERALAAWRRRWAEFVRAVSEGR
jgi:adenosine deaminase CECR1